MTTRILALSGSTRKESTNTALLRALQRTPIAEVDITVSRAIGELPIFNQDLEGENTPDLVKQFCQEIDLADGIVIACPEYVHAIPGGLKNSIDWLVSRTEIIDKPIALVHASHRGQDMLGSLRLVLSTVSDRFTNNIFLQIPLTAKSMDEVDKILSQDDNVILLDRYLREFRDYIEGLVQDPNHKGTYL